MGFLKRSGEKPIERKSIPGLRGRIYPVIGRQSEGQPRHGEPCAGLLIEGGLRGLIDGSAVILCRTGGAVVDAGIITTTDTQYFDDGREEHCLWIGREPAQAEAIDHLILVTQDAE